MLDFWTGWIKRESGPEHPGDLNGIFSVGDNGHAYGRYQFDNRYCLQDFLRLCVSTSQERYGDFSAFIDIDKSQLQNNKDLICIWRQKCYNYKEEFTGLQDQFAYDYYFVPTYNHLIKDLGIDLKNRSLALRGSVFSFAIRNGSGECVSLYVMRGCNNSMTDEQILRKSYAYFGMNDDGRWPEQLIDALSFLSNERSDSNLTKIANCGHDENGNYTGGQAGDQTGEEYHIIDWYNRPWNCVLRWPNKDEANLAADMATQAANNDLVGYNQDDRISFYNHLKASDWRPEQITVPCNADCSAASNAIWIGVGNRCNVESLECLNKELCTGEMKEAYSDAGFEVLTDERYLNSSDYLLPGDVLLYEGHHTAINLTPGSNSSNEENTDNTQYEYDELHVKGQHGLNEYFDSGIDEDGERGPKTLRAIIKAHQHAINMDHGSDQGFVPLDEDGDFGPNTEEYSGRYFIKPNDTSYDVTVLECALYCHGFDANGIEYPGEYGGGLMGAIHQYQGNDDNVGKNMWKSLCST